MNKITGIYKITNVVNNKIYIGSTTNLKSRVAHHKSYLRRGIHGNKHLQAAYTKYGEESFKFELIEECLEKDLQVKEKQLCEFYKANDKNYGYNIAIVEEDRFLIPKEYYTIAASKRKKTCEERGYYFSEETKNRISESNKGKKGFWKGKTHSEASKQKIREARKGTKLSDETKEKLSEAGKERRFTKDHKEKLGDAQRKIAQRLKKCDYCDVVMGELNCRKYHDNHCKNKPKNE